MTVSPDGVLAFWFEECAPEQWFAVDEAFDATIRERFVDANRRAREGAFDAWAQTPRGRLALIIVLDQFSRNLHRGSPLAWAADPLALALTRQGIELGHDTALCAVEKPFFYMPLMHSEVLEDQERCVVYFSALAEGGEERAQKGLEAALRHREIIARFGRFPHRNAILGRETPAEEAAFLMEPNSSF